MNKMCTGILRQKTESQPDENVAAAENVISSVKLDKSEEKLETKLSFS